MAKDLKQLVNDGFTIVSATVKDIVRNYAILTLELEEPTAVEETIDKNILPDIAKNSIYTVVGTKYHSAKAHVGDIVRFKVVKGTTTLFNEDNESLGVLPQSDKKIMELQEIGAPVVLNQFARTDFHTLENAFVVSYVVEDKFIFLREITEDDFNNDEESSSESFVSLRDLCQSSLSIELFVDFDGDFSIYFEDEGIGFEYKVVECEGIKGVNL